MSGNSFSETVNIAGQEDRKIGLLSGFASKTATFISMQTFFILCSFMAILALRSFLVFSTSPLELFVKSFFSRTFFQVLAYGFLVYIFYFLVLKTTEKRLVGIMSNGDLTEREKSYFSTKLHNFRRIVFWPNVFIFFLTMTPWIFVRSYFTDPDPDLREIYLASFVRFVCWGIFCSGLLSMLQSSYLNTVFISLSEIIGVTSTGNNKVVRIDVSFVTTTVFLIATFGVTATINAGNYIDIVEFLAEKQQRFLDGEYGTGTLDEVDDEFRRQLHDYVEKSPNMGRMPIASIVLPSDLVGKSSVGKKLTHFYVELITWFFYLFVAVWFERERIRQIEGFISNVSRVMGKMLRGGVGFNTRFAITSYDSFGYMVGYINFLLQLLEEMISGIQSLTGDLRKSNEEILESSCKASSEVKALLGRVSRVSEDTTLQSSEVIKNKEYLNGVINAIITINRALSDQMILVMKAFKSSEDFAENVAKVRKISLAAENLSRNLVGVANTGTNAVNSAMSAINLISDTSKNMSRSMGVITQIAAQTNLLSMNAAIEAAHAGETGRGFAVVANEVRALSETSTQQTRKIREEIVIMDDRIAQGLDVSLNVQRTLREIITGIEQSSAIIDRIAATMEEQASGVEGIVQGIATVNESNRTVINRTRNQKEKGDELQKSMQILLVNSHKVLDETRLQVQFASTVSTKIDLVRDVAARNIEKVEELGRLITKFTLKGNNRSKIA